MSNNDAALEAIRAALGASAPLLQHLPSDKVRIKSFDAKKGDRPNTMPIRMLFGQIKEGQDKDSTVWILLQHNHSADRSPCHFFNIFDRFDSIVGQINVEDAVRRTNPTAPFKCLKKSGDIDGDQLRAVTKYYFISKEVNTSSPWTVGPQFMKSLRAACILAREYGVKVAANQEREKSREAAAQKECGIKLKLEPPASKTCVGEDNGVSVKLGEGSASVTSSVTRVATPLITKARRTPQPPKPQRAPIASIIPSTQESSDSSDLFIPENDHVQAAFEPPVNNTRVRIPDISTVPKAMIGPSYHIPPLDATANVSDAPNVNRYCDFLIRSDSDGTNDDSATMDTSRSTPAHTESGETDKSLNSQSPDNFVSAYRKNTKDRDAIKNEIKAVTREQKAVQEAMEAELAGLEDRKQKLKEVLRSTGVAKKRLRESLSEKERGLLVLGMELAEKRLKRLKTNAQSEEGTSGDED
ncbi:hypothetical protein AA0116_g7424 [Alternaria tenuissima]|nr:hypothetical protein AA0116_g7424 [Alternaria tenuissima]